MRSATLLAAAAGALVVPALVSLGETCRRALLIDGLPLLDGLTTRVDRILRPMRRAGVDGILPSDRERLRLQIAVAVAGLVAGEVLIGMPAALGFAAACLWLSSRSLVWHRARYRRMLEEGASAAALALADALAAGHSVRGALMLSGKSLRGPVGRELRAVGHELELGAETDGVLENLRSRAGSHRIDLIVAAVGVQRRSGGSLATLLRGIAATIEDHDRLDGEARAATAQARFTSVVVVLLPVAGLMLAELSSPGIFGRITDSAAGVLLLAAAAALQLTGMLLIRHLTRLDR